jgi:hypothetical protein
MNDAQLRGMRELHRDVMSANPAAEGAAAARLDDEIREIWAAANDLIVAVKSQSRHSLDCCENGPNCILCGLARRLELALAAKGGAL